MDTNEDFIDENIIDDDSDVEENPNIVSPAPASGLIAAIWPPVKLVAIFEIMFCWYLGEPSKNIIQYHCRKILVNRCGVACLPSIFAIYIVSYLHMNFVLQAYVVWASIQAFVALAYCIFTIATKFKYTRQMKELALYRTDNLDRIITKDYISLNNFIISFPNGTTLIITAHWYIFISRFDFTIVNITNVDLTVVKIDFVHETSAVRNPYVIVRAKIRSKNIRSFSFRIRMEQLRDIKVYLSSAMDGIDREAFATVFLDQVMENNKYFEANATKLEPCFCCCTETANVKIVHACDRSFPSPCRPCNCRPIWCVECLARIFAAEQAEMNVDPYEWKDGQASCPTCRAEFCLLDVAFIETTETIKSEKCKED